MILDLTNELRLNEYCLATLEMREGGGGRRGREGGREGGRGGEGREEGRERGRDGWLLYMILIGMFNSNPMTPHYLN